MADLQVLVFDNGEALIGEVVPQDSAAVIVMQHILQLMRSPQGFALMDYYPMVAETAFEFNVVQLRHPPLTPNIDITNAWNQRFGVGIQIATTKPRSILEH